MISATWIWNGCLPDFPWWCDGFVWTAIVVVVGAVAFLVASVYTR